MYSEDEIKSYMETKVTIGDKVIEVLVDEQVVYEGKDWKAFDQAGLGRIIIDEGISRDYLGEEAKVDMANEGSYFVGIISDIDSNSFTINFD